MEVRAVPTGVNEEVFGRVDKLPIFDAEDIKHYWIIIGTWHVDPEESMGMLTSQNLVSISAVGCYRCERPYSPLLASIKCKGYAVD